MFRNPVTDLVVVLVVVLLIFGPKRLPLLGRSLGQGMREFKDSITGESKATEDDERPVLEKSSSASQTAAGAASQAAPSAAGNPVPEAPAPESVQAAPSERRS